MIVKKGAEIMSFIALATFIILFLIIAAVFTGIFLLVVSINKKSRPSNYLERRVEELEEENRMLKSKID